jgi:muramoyltetrapeptide carboxypeptidase LdcA involved in peptidoglycan recycling
MRPELTVPPKLAAGDRVAVVSPSFAAPGVFPAVHDQAMRRLREDIGLEPVEYPTTRRPGAPPQDRAADLMAAFADPGWNLAVSRWIRPAADYAGCVLLLETSEEMPSAEETFRMLRNAGERGLLGQFPAILVGTAKASSLHQRTSPEQRERYRADQRTAILRALGSYNPGAMVLFNLDFGHTDPQWVLPYGGTVTVDGPARRVTAHY